jgi:D-amino-acid dehydrogenase
MKVVVLGSGVIGVTSAWYLAQAGHEVVVVDRQPGPALETSFANAGEISPGYASPWAAPGIPAKALKWLLMEHAPLILRPQLDMNMVRWLLSMLRNCTAERYATNKGRMVRIAEFSRDCLIELRQTTGIHYDGQSLGTLQLFREAAQMDGIAKDIEVLKHYGVTYEVRSAAECTHIEPGLANSLVSLAGGLRLPDDETGDCFKFTSALARLCADRGVTFNFNNDVRAIIADGDAIASVITTNGKITGDAYVVALGSFTPKLLSGLAMRVPIYPVKGYSITVPITAPDRAPVSTLLDESYKIAITRLGGRIRVGGMAEISGYNNRLPERRRSTLMHSLNTLFPGAAEPEGANYWSGLRPMTPDSTPIVGRTPYKNLFLNAGHGTLGWTMACGSGHVIADLVSGRHAAIDVHDLSLSRY